MKIVITGGAGFIGSNTAKYFSDQKNEVVIFDNFSRKGSQKNLEWLQSSARKINVINGDIRNLNDLSALKIHLAEADAVFHLAAQVAVTTSVLDPKEDFEINAAGTFNVLELMRATNSQAKFIYSSTNKVYGGMEETSVREIESRYEYDNLPGGVAEDQQLDFHSPYGCSKGAADQYVHDYARIYGMDTVVLRQSCIYGPRQFGVEDQGWVAWFMIATLLNKQITIYGNGKQVRDLLYIDDLIKAYDLVIKHKDVTRGKIYNIGGGPHNTLSIWSEFRPLLENLFHKQLHAEFAPSRAGDQPIFVANISKAKKEFAWQPKVNVLEGIAALHRWISENSSLFTF